MPASLSILCLTLALTAAAEESLPADALAHVRAAEQARIGVMARVAPSVVAIFGEDRGGGGAGVLISEDGYGVTNFHVVAEFIDKRKGVGGLSDGKLYPLQVLGIDPTGDVAMFKLSGKPAFTSAPLGNSDTVSMGDWVFAMGNPFILAEDFTPTVTHGIVSGVHRYQFGSATAQLVYSDCIQVDASINPGNSGGPLFNMNGEVIGINGRASFEQRGRVNVGIGYAISINQIKRFIPGLRAGLLTEHGALGATVMDLGYRKVVFEKMLEPSVASAAGIRVGDRLLEFAGRKIQSTNEFASILGTFPAGWPVDIRFDHNGGQASGRVRLERLPLKLQRPFKEDETLNLIQTRRVLAACRTALGQPPASSRVAWRSSRSRSTGAVLAVEQLSCLETGAGNGECSITSADGASLRMEYDARSLRLRSASQPAGAEADPVNTRFRWWLAVRRALQAPLTDDGLKRWRHRGADDVDGLVAEVLEYDSAEGEPLLVSFHPDLFWPVRVRAKAGDGITGGPAVEVNIAEYRDINGARWPHRFETYVNGEAEGVEIVAGYQVSE